VTVSEAGKESLDISTLGAVHQEECVLKVIFHIYALGSELLSDFLPTLLDSFEVTDLHGGSVWQTLR